MEDITQKAMQEPFITKEQEDELNALMDKIVNIISDIALAEGEETVEGKRVVNNARYQYSLRFRGLSLAKTLKDRVDGLANRLLSYEVEEGIVYTKALEDKRKREGEQELKKVG